MEHPDHPGRYPDSEHFDLGNGLWADQRLRLTHSQAQQIQAAQMVADFDTRREFRGALGIVRAALFATPAEWREQHYDNTLATIRYALEGYEQTAEAALMTPEQRRLIAEANEARDETFGRVFTAAWNVSDESPDSWTAWANIDSVIAHRLCVRGIEKWKTLNKELGERLKGDAASSDATESPPRRRTRSSSPRSS